MQAGSRTRRRILGCSLAAGGLALVPGWSGAQTPSPEPPVLPVVLPEVLKSPDEPPAAVDLTKEASDFLVAPVKINGAGPFRFVVDTGASTSCVSKVLAAALGLPAGPPIQVHTTVGRRARPSAVLDEIEVGARIRRKVNAPVLPMDAFGVDGVLGVDWLKGQRLTLDFAAKRLEVGKSRPEESARGRVVVEARRRAGQLTIVDAELNGRSISALIDSGSEFSMANTPLRRLMESVDPDMAGKIIKVGMVSIANERFEGDQLNVGFLRLGGLTLGNVPVVFADLPVFGLWEMEHKPALMLGMDVLMQFDVVSLDFGRSKVGFDLSEPPAI